MASHDASASELEKGLQLNSSQCATQPGSCRTLSRDTNKVLGRILGRICHSFQRHRTETGHEPQQGTIAPAQQARPSKIIVRTLEKFRRGYPNLAAFLDSHENFMLYRRFGYLQARLLLQKQDELRILEEELDAMDDVDRREDFDKLYKRQEQGEDRLRLLTTIEIKFREYATLMSAAQQLVSLNNPTSSEQRSAANYIHNYGPVHSAESDFLRCKEDLITLRPGREYAWLDARIEQIIRWLHCSAVEYMFCSQETREKSSDPDNVYYCKERIAACALSIIVLMILFLLIVPTYLLMHFANETETGFLTSRAVAVCIGILLVFTLLFSAALSLFTGAKRHEILGAAAAYAAVLVVFLGNVGTSGAHALAA